MMVKPPGQPVQLVLLEITTGFLQRIVRRNCSADGAIRSGDIRLGSACSAEAQAAEEALSKQLSWNMRLSVMNLLRPQMDICELNDRLKQRFCLSLRSRAFKNHAHSDETDQGSGSIPAIWPDILGHPKPRQRATM
jgi:hypothetical protein